MKKIISLVLVALFVFSLSVSAFASSAEYVDYNGHSLPDISTVWNSDSYSYAFLYQVDGLYRLTLCNKKPVYTNVDRYGATRADYNVLYGDAKFYSLSGDSWTGGNTNGNDIWFNYSADTIFWASTDILHKNGSVWLSGPVCTGESCPATDVNHDGICDDCGMRLMNLVRIPTPPVFEVDNKNTVMFYSGDTYYYTGFSSPSSYTIRGYVYGERMRATTSSSVDVIRWVSHDGINWTIDYTGTAKDYYPGEQGWTLMSSTFNWYDSYENTTDPFFPVPLWAEVEKVTQGEIPGMTANLTEVVTILTVLGVGCLALLILLKLFGKRSLIYRG